MTITVYVITYSFIYREVALRIQDLGYQHLKIIQ